MRKKIIVFIAIFTYVITYVFNFTLNSEIALSTNFRNLQYDTWKEISKNTNFFNEVQSRDFLIARNQNDAYEYNAATFYLYTGKRLAYFYNTSTIYPEIESCSSVSKCVLPNPKKIALTRLGTLNRIKNPTIKDSDTDWVVNNMFSTQTDQISIWATDLISLTPEVIFLYLVKFDNNSPSARLNMSTFRSYLVSKPKNKIFPKFADKCLVSSHIIKAKFDSNYIITKWSLPSNKLQTIEQVPILVNYSDANAGTC